jgi:hypothetical protein
MRRNVKNVFNEYLNKLEKELHIEVEYFDYSILDKANLLLREITKNLERKIFKGNKYLFYYYLFFDLPCSKDRIIINIPVSVGEKTNSYLDAYNYLVKTKDHTVKLTNGSASLFIVVFDTEVRYRWDNWEKVTLVFEKVSKKENIRLDSGKNGSVKFLALEIPIEVNILEYLV